MLPSGDYLARTAPHENDPSSFLHGRFFEGNSSPPASSPRPDRSRWSGRSFFFFFLRSTGDCSFRGIAAHGTSTFPSSGPFGFVPPLLPRFPSDYVTTARFSRLAAFFSRGRGPPPRVMISRLRTRPVLFSSKLRPVPQTLPFFFVPPFKRVFFSRTERLSHFFPSTAYPEVSLLTLCLS